VWLLRSAHHQAVLCLSGVLIFSYFLRGCMEGCMRGGIIRHFPPRTTRLFAAAAGTGRPKNAQTFGHGRGQIG
jgi:hypothetical protein